MKVDYINNMGTDLSCVDAARVSFNKTSDWVYCEGSEDQSYCGDLCETGRTQYPRLKVADEKLINYLASHEHYSPFNHTFITLRVKAPIFVARQLQKHEYMPWNEISRRYVDDEPEFYQPEVWRGKPKGSIKQGSVTPDEQPVKWWGVDVGTYDFNITALERYKWMLEIGIAPEQARIVLPQSIYTEWYWSGTLKAWAKMYNLRTHEGVQQETREIAKMCGDIIAPLYPISWKALTQ